MNIAKQMARLHCLFEVLEGKLRDHHGSEVGLWDQLTSWMGQARGYNEFKMKEDTERVKKLELDKIELELNKIMEAFTNPTENDKLSTVFCHNDMLGQHHERISHLPNTTDRL